jgi:hypothetical protein
MSEKNAPAIDKSRWGEGPWQTEPDRVEFQHAGLPCLMLRSRFGNWCGYAAVPPGHRLHGINYSDIEFPLDAHGGVTYSDKCSGDICHVPGPGEPDDVWWFGFDCGHAWDYCPAMEAMLLDAGVRSPRERVPDAFGQRYCDLASVRRWTEELAEQLAELAN